MFHAFTHELSFLKNNLSLGLYENTQKHFQLVSWKIKITLVYAIDCVEILHFHYVLDGTMESGPVAVHWVMVVILRYEWII